MAAEFNSTSYLPPGFRFNPTDQELVGHYLRRKVGGQTQDAMAVDDIRDKNLYSAEPEKIYFDLNISEYDGLYKEFYFFTEVKKKFGNTGNKDQKYMNRAAGIGTWKVQGHKKDVWNLEHTEVIGNMDTLNFQIDNKNCSPSWIMHEYTLPGSELLPKYWALCRIKRNCSSSSKNNRQKRPLLVESCGNGDFRQPNKKICLEHYCRDIEASTSETLQGMPRTKGDIREWANGDVQQKSSSQLDNEITAIPSSSELSTEPEPAYNDYIDVDDLFLEEIGSGSLSSGLGMPASSNTDGSVSSSQKDLHQLQRLNPAESVIGERDIVKAIAKYLGVDDVLNQIGKRENPELASIIWP